MDFLNATCLLQQAMFTMSSYFEQYVQGFLFFFDLHTDVFAIEMLLSNVFDLFNVR